MILRRTCFTLLATLALFEAAAGTCPTEPHLENHTGPGSTGCTCFVPGEEAAAVFNLPPGDFPIQILQVGFGWGSAAGGQGDSLEQAFHIYSGVPPLPGAPIFSQIGPVLTDGAINLFNVEIVEEVIVNSGPFTVSLEFANSNVGGGAFTPTIVHDGAGCIVGRNWVFADPGFWLDPCLLVPPLSGNWVMLVEYRKVTCAPVAAPGEVPDGNFVPGVQLTIARGGGSSLDLSWGISCSATDETYSVYEGEILPVWMYNLFPKNCDTGGTTANVSPSGGNRYYVVVPRDSVNEGSYGTANPGPPRPPAIATCRPPVAATCP